MNFIERARNRRNTKNKEKPVKKEERPLLAQALIDTLNLHIDATPEFQRAYAERGQKNRTSLGPDYDFGPITYESKHGTIAVLRGVYMTCEGAVQTGVVVKFTPRTGEEPVKIGVYRQEMSAHTPGNFAHEPFMPQPYQIGNFSIQGVPMLDGDGALTPNSLTTYNKIMGLTPLLFPALAHQKRMEGGISER